MTTLPDLIIDVAEMIDLLECPGAAPKEAVRALLYRVGNALERRSSVPNLHQDSSAVFDNDEDPVAAATTTVTTEHAASVSTDDASSHTFNPTWWVESMTREQAETALLPYLELRVIGAFIVRTSSVPGRHVISRVVRTSVVVHVDHVLIDIDNPPPGTYSPGNWISFIRYYNTHSSGLLVTTKFGEHIQTISISDLIVRLVRRATDHLLRYPLTT